MPSRPRPDRHEFPTLPRRPIRVLLDGVDHLSNIGTMFRLCDAFRVERLYIAGFTLHPHRRNFVKAAAGTSSWVAWESGTDATAVVRACKEEGYGIVVVELADDSLAPEQLRTDRPMCL